MPTQASGNKPKERSTTANRHKNKTTRKRASKRRKNKKQKRTVSPWLRNLLAVTTVVFLTTVFYYFFIKPYSYRWKPCYGRKCYGVCLPHGYEVHGIDISHYQGNINWPILSGNREGNYPLRFIYMKATEGGDLGDTTFVRNFDLARQHGFIRGAYHFFSPGTDANRQADFYIQTVKLQPGDLPPVLDIEVLGKNTAEELQAKAKTWLLKIEKHYGVKPVIYASYKFKIKYLNDSLLNTYPYWIAHYHVDSVRYGCKWDFWQHSDAGRIAGINENVDLNVYNGTPEELMGFTIP